MTRSHDQHNPGKVEPYFFWHAWNGEVYECGMQVRGTRWGKPEGTKQKKTYTRHATYELSSHRVSCWCPWCTDSFRRWRSARRWRPRWKPRLILWQMVALSMKKVKGRLHLHLLGILVYFNGTALSLLSRVLAKIMQCNHWWCSFSHEPDGFGCPNWNRDHDTPHLTKHHASASGLRLSVACKTMRHLHSSGRFGSSALCGRAYPATRSHACRWDGERHRNPCTGQPPAWCEAVHSRHQSSCSSRTMERKRDGSGTRSCHYPSPEQPAQQENEAENHLPEEERDHHLVGEVALRLKLHRGHVVAVQRPHLVALRCRQGAQGHQQLQDAVPLCRWQEYQTGEDVVHHVLRLLFLLLVQVSCFQADEVPAELQHLHIHVFRSQVRRVAWPGDLLNWERIALDLALNPQIPQRSPRSCLSWCAWPLRRSTKSRWSHT